VFECRLQSGTGPPEIVYRGRSGCCAGVDQIIFRVPDGVAGCYLPVAVKIGQSLSNTATLPVTAAPSRECSDTSWLSGVDLQNLAGRTTFNLGYNSLTRGWRAENVPGDDSGVSTFYRFSSTNYDFSNLQPPLLGSCTVTVQTTPFNWPSVTAPGCRWLDRSHRATGNKANAEHR